MAESTSPYGSLFLVATPIGHLEDITLRAIKVLRAAALIAAEDTRKARWLLRQLDIEGTVISCYQQNEAGRVRRILETLAAGEDVALICDAGTPAVSDPGAVLTAAVVEAGYRAVAIPGPSAVSAALSVTGFGGDGYHFLGFLPRGHARRTARLRALAGMRGPLVLFESPRRIAGLLSLAAEVLGDRPAVLCRELTKTYEEILRGSLSEIATALPSEPLGEMTLVIRGLEPKTGDSAEPPSGPLLEHARARAGALLAQGLGRSEVARQLVSELGGALDRGAAYQLALELGAAPDTAPPAAVSFQVRGHPAIRGTHRKTLEFKRDAAVSPKETCVVGAAADWDPAALKALKGRVRLSIEAGQHRDCLEADISRRFRSASRIVFRKSARPGDVTLGLKASKGAADLQRELLAALANEDIVATVTIESMPEEE